MKPLAFNRSMFSRVAWLEYMLSFIAGAMTTGALVARTMQLSRSSAMPHAILAMAFAVAGAISTRSAASA